MKTPFKVGLLVAVLLGALAVTFQVVRFYNFAIRPRSKFEAMLTNSVKPEELRAWALGVHDTSRTTQVYGQVSSPVPIALVGLYKDFKPHVFAFKATSDDAEHVMVSYEAGHFGNWGVEIGQTNRAMPIGSGSRRYTPWLPGICFFYGPG